ncbi:10322_t:CDS:2, partial [Scutellospora calospora]
IQYSMGGGGIYLIKKSPYFGDVQLTSIERNEVDVESSLWKKITENQDIDFQKTHTYITYLAAKDMPCKFKYNNESQCSGNLILYKSHISQDVQDHRYIKVDSEKVDIILLQDLFLGKGE